MASDLNSLQIELNEFSLAIAADARKIVKKGGQDVVRDAQAFCPVRTGKLRSSIGVDYGVTGLSFEAGPTAAYGLWVEAGTSRMAPRAYLGPAFDRNVPQIVAAFDTLGGRVL